MFERSDRGRAVQRVRLALALGIAVTLGPLAGVAPAKSESVRGELALVDPVPQLLESSGLSAEPARLVSGGRPVTGVAADGVARLVLRLAVERAGEYRFEVGPTEGTSPAVRLSEEGWTIAYGGLAAPGSDDFAPSVLVRSIDPDGAGPAPPVVLAVYRAPRDFVRAGSEEGDGVLGERGVQLRVSLAETGDPIAEAEIRVIRPPVVLIHGLWAKPTHWLASGLHLDPRLSVAFANYSVLDHGGGGVLDSARLVVQTVKHHIRDVAATESVAVAQADVVGYSLGGLVARAMPLVEERFARPSNDFAGPVHKLITVDTPHLGSKFAAQLDQAGAICHGFWGRHGWGLGEAIHDLSPGSEVLERLALTDGERNFRTHAVASLAEPEQERTANLSWARVGMTFLCPSLLGLDSLDDVFGERHDTIVGISSQLAEGLGIGGAVKSTIMPGLIHNAERHLFPRGPDALSHDVVDGVKVPVDTDVPELIIELLNAPLDDGWFTPIAPSW